MFTTYTAPVFMNLVKLMGIFRFALNLRPVYLEKKGVSKYRHRTVFEKCLCTQTSRFWHLLTFTFATYLE